MSTQALLAKVTERRRAIADLVRRRDELARQIEVGQVELRAYEDALTLVEGAEEDTLSNNAPVAVEEPSGYAAARMSDLWVLAFDEMRRRRPQTISIAEIKSVGGSHGLPITDVSIRKALGKFTGRGWLDRVAMGKYSITDTGVRALETQSSRAGRLQARLEELQNVSGEVQLEPRPPS
jgi:hypothetical protein